MRFLFLRHGESARNAHTGEEPLTQEQGDVLTARGCAQAAAAGEALREQGITRLLTSPMRRATETAAAVGAALDLEPEPLSYAFEYHRGETFEEAIERVHQLKARLEADAAEAGDDELPLLVTHGILTRFFLLDAVIGAAFRAEMYDRIWHLGSANCALTTFKFGEVVEPGGAPPAIGWTCLSWMARPWDPQ
ncbi:MAG: histidine phosphatase family protein [Actinobacteria bacterium]|nr:histidine phosphatase family protein [Actinomycetota bacterium]